MKTVYLCLGGNLGNRKRLLDEAKVAIAQKCGKITAESGIYETAPWHSDSKSAYLNQVICISTSLSAEKLMLKLLGIEIKLGRKRNHDKNADRSCDLDILFYGNEIIKSKSLETPHPRIEERKFVLRPLMDLAPELKHPKSGKTIKELYKNCNDKLSVVAYKSPFFICIEGNIGSGKSTLAKELSKSLNATYLPEQFEKNSLLPLYYQQPDKYAFLLEYSFLLSRFQQMTDVFAKNPELIVSDYSIYKCLWFANLNLKLKDRKLFKKHFNGIEEQLTKPDLIIYLDTPEKNLLKNIHIRSRNFESGIQKKYLLKVKNEYEKGLKQLNSVRQMKVKISKYNEKLTAQLLNKIKKELKTQD